MGAGRFALAAVGATVVLTVVPSSAGAASPASTTSDQQVAAVAARVTRLTVEYRRHSAAAGTAAAELGAAYARVRSAEDAAEASARQADRARSQQAALALNLYVYGTTTQAGLTLLTADSPEDGLWRLAVGAPLGERLMARAAGQRRTVNDRVNSDDALAADAQRAAGELATALGRLRDEEEAARFTLDQARAELARLDAAARRQRAAREAADSLARAEGDATAARLASRTPVTALGIPAEFEKAYRQAAPTCPGMSWTLLAAVGQIESGHGRNNGPSSAGAIGPMQFMPATFAAYATDGDGDGIRSAWDPQDAVFTAARYLCASGAGQGPDGVRRALFAYNHAGWYVDLVLGAQTAIAAREGAAPPP